jgi:hypothetical protein
MVGASEEGRFRSEEESLGGKLLRPPRLVHEPNACDEPARESSEVYNAGFVMSAANPTKIAVLQVPYCK